MLEISIRILDHYIHYIPTLTAAAVWCWVFTYFCSFLRLLQSLLRDIASKGFITLQCVLTTNNCLMNILSSTNEYIALFFLLILGWNFHWSQEVSIFFSGTNTQGVCKWLSKVYRCNWFSKWSSSQLTAVEAKISRKLTENSVERKKRNVFVLQLFSAIRSFLQTNNAVKL